MVNNKLLKQFDSCERIKAHGPLLCLASYITEDIYTVLNVCSIQQRMFLFMTDQTQIAYSLHQKEQNSKPCGTESHKTAGISKSICMNIHELNDHVRYVLDNIKPFLKTYFDM